jgi:hypothetical protein
VNKPLIKIKRWLNTSNEDERKQNRRRHETTERNAIRITRLHASCCFATYCSHVMTPLFMSMSHILWHRPECDTVARELQSTLQFAYREAWRHFWLRITSLRCCEGILTIAPCNRGRFITNNTTILGHFSPYNPFHLRSIWILCR